MTKEEKILVTTFLKDAAVKVSEVAKQTGDTASAWKNVFGEKAQAAFDAYTCVTAAGKKLTQERELYLQSKVAELIDA